VAEIYYIMHVAIAGSCTSLLRYLTIGTVYISSGLDINSEKVKTN